MKDRFSRFHRQRDVRNVADVIGMVMSINELVHGKSKQNKDYTKRDILILDRTGQITVTLWYQTVGPCRLKSSFFIRKCSFRR